MRRKLYRVVLPTKEREELGKMTRTGKARAREILRAQILLKADEGPQGESKGDPQIARELKVALRTVAATRERYVAGGLGRALHDAPRSGQPRRLSPQGQAKLEAIARSAPPAGRVRWTLELLRDRMVELKVVEYIGKETVRGALKRGAQALATEVVVHRERRWGVPGTDGRCAGLVRAAV